MNDEFESLAMKFCRHFYLIPFENFSFNLKTLMYGHELSLLFQTLFSGRRVKNHAPKMAGNGVQFNTVCEEAFFISLAGCRMPTGSFQMGQEEVGRGSVASLSVLNPLQASCWFALPRPHTFSKAKRHLCCSSDNDGLLAC